MCIRDRGVPDRNAVVVKGLLVVEGIDTPVYRLVDQQVVQITAPRLQVDAGKPDGKVIDKRNGIYRVVKTIGSSSDVPTIEALYLQGKKWISRYLGEQDIFEQSTRELEEKQVTERLLSNIENILLNGTGLILNHA